MLSFLLLHLPWVGRKSDSRLSGFRESLASPGVAEQLEIPQNFDRRLPDKTEEKRVTSSSATTTTTTTKRTNKTSVDLWPGLFLLLLLLLLLHPTTLAFVSVRPSLADRQSNKKRKSNIKQREESVNSGVTRWARSVVCLGFLPHRFADDDDDDAGWVDRKREIERERGHPFRLEKQQPGASQGHFARAPSRYRVPPFSTRIGVRHQCRVHVKTLFVCLFVCLISLELCFFHHQHAKRRDRGDDSIQPLGGIGIQRHLLPKMSTR